MPERPARRPARPPGHALADVAAHLRVRLALTAEDAAATLPAVTGITVDSADARPGDLFAALPGSRTHGARYAGDAAVRGAVAVLTDAAGEPAARASGVPLLVVDDARARLGELASWLYGDPARDLLLVGVTGTNGKTTTTHLLDAVLRAGGHRTGLVGTVQTRIGDRVTGSVRTTPEAPELHALLGLMREEGVTAVSLEVSSHALALSRVDGLRFHVAAFTNLSADHLDFHGDMERYYAAKAGLFTPERTARAVVCVDDPWGRRLAAESAVPVTTVAARASGTDADWRVGDVATSPDGSSTFGLAARDGTALTLRCPLPGKFNVANAALAAVCGLAAGVAPADVVRGLAAAEGVPGRMERVSPQGSAAALAVVDYAHTAEAVATAVAAVRASVPGRVVVVLGAGGDRDPAKRGPMGAAAAAVADLVVVTDDNPRSEDPATIRRAVLAGARPVAARRGTDVVEEADRAAAIARAVRGLEPGDAVLVAGKGHEPGQEVAGTVVPFDDRAVLRAALAARPVTSSTAPSWSP